MPTKSTIEPMERKTDYTPILGVLILIVIAGIVAANYNAQQDQITYEQEMRATMMEYRETNPYKYAAELCRLARNAKERDQYCRSF